MIFNKADWERSSPEWLRFHSGMESSRGFRNQLSTHGKVAPHTGTGCLLVVGVQRTNTMEQGRQTCDTDGAGRNRVARLYATLARVQHSWSKSLLREVPLRKVDLPCKTTQCLAVAPATLTAVSALARRPDCWKKPCMLSTQGPSSQGWNAVSFSICHGEPLFDLPVDGIGCCRRRNRPYLRIRDVVDPVYKAKSCSQVILCTDGACADLPVAIFHSAEHGIVDPNQGLVHLLGDSCARWEHNTPLVHPCQTRAFFSRVRLMELKSVTWARQSISQASNQSFRGV